jgi:GIY-YIG catalytic domain
MVVYLIYNTVNGKIYIGKTEKSLAVRWSGHCVAAFTMNSPYYIHRAIRKYGKEAFLITRLSDAPSWEDRGIRG